MSPFQAHSGVTKSVYTWEIWPVILAVLKQKEKHNTLRATANMIVGDLEPNNVLWTTMVVLNWFFNSCFIPQKEVRSMADIAKCSINIVPDVPNMTINPEVPVPPTIRFPVRGQPGRTLFRSLECFIVNSKAYITLQTRRIVLYHYHIGIKSSGSGLVKSLQMSHLTTLHYQHTVFTIRYGETFYIFGCHEFWLHPECNCSTKDEIIYTFSPHLNTLLSCRVFYFDAWRCAS